MLSPFHHFLKEFKCKERSITHTSSSQALKFQAQNSSHHFAGCYQHFTKSGLESRATELPGIWRKAAIAKVHPPHFTDCHTEVQGGKAAITFLRPMWQQLGNECLPVFSPMVKMITWAVYFHCHQPTIKSEMRACLIMLSAMCSALLCRTTRAECSLPSGKPDLDTPETIRRQYRTRCN